jgi:hypothetical protein
MKPLLVCSIALLSITASMLMHGLKPAHAADARTPVLVELFTSEGCSSCPPADRFLEKLDRQPVPGVEIIVLSEHVDYWNHIGWKDPYSSHLYSERQRIYARRFGLDSVYTPQMVVDGATEFVGSNSTLADKAFAKALSTPKVAVRMSLALLGTAKTLRARVEIDALPASLRQREVEVYVAVAINHSESHVSGGENGGRTLAHVAVLRDLVKIGTLNRDEGFVKETELTLESGLDAHNLRVIAFVQEPKQGRIVGAAERLLVR